MSITYPRDLPNNARMTECWFDLVDDLAASSFENGLRVNLTQTFDPLWKGTFITPILEREQRPIWSAWHKSLRARKTFVAYDVRHSRLLAYPNAKQSSAIATGWNGTCSVSSIGSSGALGLSSLPAGIQLKAGDRIGLEQNSYYGYYEILEDVTASGSGAATLNVAPFLHTRIFTTSALCRVWQAKCQFTIDPSSWVENGTVENTPISFKGIQRL